MKKYFILISVFTGVVFSIFLVRSISISYNSLQRADEDINARWANVVNQYKRRTDLVPNLVRVVKAYAKHEKDLFDEIAQARASILREENNLAAYQSAQNSMSNALSKLMLIAERYPMLNSDEAFLSLQAQLEGTENRISYARSKYIQAVNHYNILVRSVPTNWIAGYLNYKVKPNFSLGNNNTKATMPPSVEL